MPPTSRGFSLIELLVVVAIIAIVAALLLPAIASVRSASNSAKCKSNLRQVGMGILAYADDFEDKVVSAGYKVNSADYHWFELIAPYYRMGRTSANQHVSMYDSAYKRNNVIVGCPNYRYTMIWRPSFGLNDHLGLPDNKSTSNWTAAASKPKQDWTLSSLTHVSTRALAGDVDGWTIGVSPNGPTWSFSRDDKRHRGKPNWLFCDIHVDSRTNNEIVWNVYDPSRAK